jgi:hypothetical protein
VQPALTVAAPATGYFVPSAHAAWMSEKLALHGVEFKRVIAPQPASTVQTFRADGTTTAAETFEGRPVMTVDGAWRDEKRDIGAGALFVPIAQPKARLVMSLLEPQAPDSFVSWGYFSTAFERKEYMENYVTEAVARQMLSQDPALKAEFERRLREDTAFAGSPDARLEFSIVAILPGTSATVSTPSIVNDDRCAAVAAASTGRRSGPGLCGRSQSGNDSADLSRALSNMGRTRESGVGPSWLRTTVPGVNVHEALACRPHRIRCRCSRPRH